MMMGGGMGRMIEMMMSPAHVEGRIAFLRTELGITDAQQPQWTAFADAMRRSARSMTDAMDKMMGGGSPASTSAPDRLQRRIAAMSAHLDAARAMLPPLQVLYAVLTDGQRKVADELLVPPIGHM
jgi:phage shock protein A